MILFHNKKHGVNFYECWYAEEPCKKRGIIRYFESSRPMTERGNWERKRTLLSDLAETEEELLAHCDKNSRYYIRKAKRDGVVCEAKIGRELSDEDIMEFIRFYIAFCESKGIRHDSEAAMRELLLRYRDAEGLSIHKAVYEGSILVYHTYLVGEKWARSLHSASLFRTIENLDSHLISSSNRLLHYEDMLYFKQQGYTTYDWGGAGLGEDVKNITEFKESFGGKEAYYYNGVQTNGLMAKLFFKFVTKR